MGVGMSVRLGRLVNHALSTLYRPTQRCGLPNAPTAVKGVVQAEINRYRTTQFKFTLTWSLSMQYL